MTKMKQVMLGRIVGGLIGGNIGKNHGNHRVAGTIIGAGTLFAARRLFPQRYAFFAATAAAAYLTKKWADHAREREASKAAHAVDGDIRDAGVVDSYAGIDKITSDGASIGDALPPAIPLRKATSGTAIH